MPAGDVLDDVAHLCRHLGVALDPPAPGAAAARPGMIRPYLRRAIADGRAAP